MVKQKVLSEIKKQPCVACGTTQNVDPCHIQSRGAGGPDEHWNVLPMCRRHHSMQHQIGWIRFGIIYPTVRRALEMRGWKIEKIGNIHKYRRSDENEF